MTTCFIPGEGFLYTIIVPGVEFLSPLSGVPGRMVGDETDGRITSRSGNSTIILREKLELYFKFIGWFW